MNSISVFALSVCVLLASLATPAFPAEMNDCIKASKLSEEAHDVAATDPALAEEKIRQAMELCDTSASLHYNLAMVYFRLQKLNDAGTELGAALKLNPDYAKALNALAYLNITKRGGDQELAKQLISRAIQLEPKNKQFRMTLDLLTGNIDTPPKSALNRPDAIAIIIGNKNYRNNVLPAVTYAVKDAATVKQYLVESLGFDEKNIILIKDASNIDFVKYFGNENDYKGILYNRIRKGRSDLFVYYSGHGAPDTNTKKAYLVPVDADPTVIKLTGYSLDVLYDNLAKLNKDKKPKSITIVLDSCFSGGSNSGMLIPDASPIFIETSTPLLTMENAVVFTSSKGNQISSWYTEKNHGLFTYFFLKNIKNAVENNQALSVEDMEKSLAGSDSVNDFAWKLYNREQEPQVIGNKSIFLVPGASQE